MFRKKPISDIDLKRSNLKECQSKIFTDGNLLSVVGYAVVVKLVINNLVSVFGEKKDENLFRLATTMTLRCVVRYYVPQRVFLSSTDEHLPQVKYPVFFF